MAIKEYTYIPNRVIDANGIADGAEIYFYQAGTTTPQAIYSDSTLSTPLSNPLSVNAGAPVPRIYLDPALSYRVVVKVDGVTVPGGDTDPYVPQLTADGLSELSVAWNDGGVTFNGIRLEIANTASALASNMIDLEVTGTAPNRFRVDRRGHIYSTGNILKLGDDTTGSQGNFQLVGTDVIARVTNFGSAGSHGVIDVCTAGGTSAAPTSITSGWQVAAFACRSWDEATDDWVTVGDITWGSLQNHGSGAFGTGMNLYIVKNNTDDLFRWLHTDVTARAIFSVAVRNEAVVLDGDNHISYYSQPSLAASVSEDDVFHFRVGNVSLGAGATLLRQTGFRVDDLSSGSDLNIGYRGLLSDAADYNLYMDGAAPNYLEGSLGVGVSVATEKLHVSGNIRATGFVRTQSTTVAGLVPAATAGAGARSFVTDATSTTFLSVVAGGGANKVPVVSDGTSWLIG